MRVRRLGLAGVAGVMALVACTNVGRPSVQADQIALPTPLRSFDASVATTIDRLESALSAVGERLQTPARAFRPSEPPSLLQTPRVIKRADLADPDDGFVIIYESASRGAALVQAQALADYLGSGFGQSNYAADTQFSVSVLDDTVIFAAWSRSRSDEPERAESAFLAMATVGEAVDVER
jgi:hypothetical protein